MTWLSHQVVTGTVVFALTEDPLLTLFGMVGAVVPDKLEGNPFRRRHFWSINLAHRGWSHAPLLYLLFMTGLYLYGEGQVLLSYAEVFAIKALFCVALGAVLHIVEDGICGTVPLLTPSSRVGVKLFKVGSVKEYLEVLLLVAAVYAVKVATGSGAVVVF